MSLTATIQKMIQEQAIEVACRAFANAGDTESDTPEVQYDDLPEGSKEWYRLRMRAALGAILVDS